MEEKLNGDTLALIFGFLTQAKDVLNAGMVCRAWRQASLDEQIWKRLSFAMKDRWALIPSTSNSARFGSYKAFYTYRMLLDMPRKGLDTKRMVEKLIYMCRPPTKEEQELADKQSQQSQQESPYKDNMLTEVLVELLCESATDVDVAALWEGYKSNPVEDLLQPIMFRGLNCKYSKTIAEELFERVKKSKGPSDICGGYLSLSNDCVDALTLLGALGHEAATEFLWEMVRKGDHGTSHAAVLGLLHLSCDSIREEIRKEIEEECLPKEIFNEFTPALTCKLFPSCCKNEKEKEEKEKEKEENEEEEESEKKAWIAKLDHALRHTAVRDCSGGLLLGIGLMGGKTARDTFLSIMEDESKNQWKPSHRVDLEIYGCSTGSIRSTYLATLCLSIGILDLRKIMVLKAKAKQDWEWCLTGMTQLLIRRLSTPPRPPHVLPLFLKIAKEKGKLEIWEEIYTSVQRNSGWQRKVKKAIGRDRDYTLFSDLDNLSQAISVMVEQDMERVLLIQHYSPPKKS